jgi:hypothetical protein
VILGGYRKPGAQYARIELMIDVDERDAGRYRHSKLYFDRRNRRQFSERQMVRFVVPDKRPPESIVVRLPFTLEADETVGFRLDPLAGCHYGRFEIRDFALCSAADLDAMQESLA